MIVLHGTWDNRPHRQGDQEGTFVVWGETGKGAKRRGRYRVVETPFPRNHPFLAPKNEVYAALTALSPDESLLLPVESEEPHSFILLLPTLSEGPPYASPELVFDRSRQQEESEPRLEPWVIHGLSLPNSAAVGTLALLPTASDESSPEVAAGADLKFWSIVARFAFDLLARQRFLPTLRRLDSGRTLARWEPLLDDPDDRQQFNALAGMMPVACRSLYDRERGRQAAVTPEALLASFLTTAVDGQIRGWLEDGLARPIRSRRSPDSLSIGERWAAALRSADATVAGTPLQFDSLNRSLQGWLAPLIQRDQEGGFRTCFRLEPPADDAEEPAQARTPERDWTLRYFLQASDDPSLLAPAAAIWKEKGRALHYLNRRFERPQERLLAGLGRAAVVFPPLEPSLQSARPELCQLTVDEAHQFLREASPLLEESGFGVLVPPWWEKRRKQLGLRLRLKSPANTGKGLMGKDAIIGYDWQLALGDNDLSPEEFNRLAAMKVPLVRIRGEWVELDAGQIERAIRFWQSRRAKGEMSLSDALRLLMGQHDGQEGLPVAGVEADGWLAELSNNLKHGERLADLPVSGDFVGELRPYQVRGYSWLAFLRQWGMGACLADDMGLGKTIQFLALLLRDRGENGHQPTLLVCPTSVVGNWRREAARFAPSLRVTVHHGADRVGGPAFAEEAREHDLVITTYPLVYRDEDSIGAIDWRGVVLDEAQNIKNPATKQAQSVRKLSAGYRIALTGTPVENRLAELWSIMEFLNPGYLGSAEGFRKHFALPIERWQNAERAGELRQLVQPFILRRLKSDPKVIQDLPEKMEMKVYCSLTREQATLYEAVVRDMMAQIEEAEDIKRKGLVLAALTKLKQVCNHPAQFLGDRSEMPGRSGKLARLEEMLDEVLAEGDRALIFTQFAGLGEMLQQHLATTLRREVLFLHGGVSQKARDKMVTRFQEDPQGPPLFILSLKAGGVGLNLMRANHVFHFDRWWNPAVENQATDRAFRIGQTRNVQVHKFLCAGTLEERIDELIESKKALADNVIGAGEGWLTELSTDQLRDVFALRREAVADD